MAQLAWVVDWWGWQKIGHVSLFMIRSIRDWIKECLICCPPPSRIWENFFFKFTQKKQKCTFFFAFLGFYPPIWDNFFWDMSFFYSILTSFSLPTVCLDKRLKSPQNSNLLCGRYRGSSHNIYSAPLKSISWFGTPASLARLAQHRNKLVMTNITTSSTIVNWW